MAVEVKIIKKKRNASSVVNSFGTLLLLASSIKLIAQLGLVRTSFSMGSNYSLRIIASFSGQIVDFCFCEFYAQYPG